MATHHDVQQLREMTEQFQAGTISAARYQAFRVPQGVYEQREAGSYMLRARLAAGIVIPSQMRVAADVAETYGSGNLHLTSRQDLQVHGVPLGNIADAVARLTEAGLSTKGGGGNTVRNIAACCYAGVCPNEAFDVTPDVLKLTETLLSDPLSFQLPRKYKIACSGCGWDCAGATVADLGFIGRGTVAGDGFAVYAGGGMGAHSRVGRLLETLILPEEAILVAEAVKRVFDRNGNRKNRHRARLRFLIEDIGFEAFEKLYRAERGEAVRSRHETSLPDIRPRLPRPTARVQAQKQPGSFSVEIAPFDGILQAGQFRALADIVERYGEKRLRATPAQTALLRSVEGAGVPALIAELQGMGLWREDPPILRHMVACAGASTCRLGICLARGLATAVRAAIGESGLQLDGATGQLSIHISGCPNSCGRHPVAAIGLYGAGRRVKGGLAPHYIVQLGGRVEEGRTQLASGGQPIPARNVPAFLVNFLRAFERSEQYPDFERFLEAGGRAATLVLGAVYGHVPDGAPAAMYYTDWGAGEPFSLAGRGAAECGAGVFDLIDLDLQQAATDLAAGRLFSVAASAARALLVTRGHEADSERHAIDLFERLFVREGLVPGELGSVLEKARKACDSPVPESAFDASSGEVGALLAAANSLYESLGPSLRLAAPVCDCAPGTPCPPALFQLKT
jgi:sulfite reductase (ferredoxin)